MPKIEIVEKDLTTPGSDVTNDNVVYVPGLVWINESNFKKEKGDTKSTKEIALPPHKPMLFNSVAEFEAKCGLCPFKFTSDVKYAEFEEGDNALFSTDSYADGDSILFKKDEYDPSYIYAKELLASGLSVIYERLNGDPDKEIEPDGEPYPVTVELPTPRYDYIKEYLDLTSAENIVKVQGTSYNSVTLSITTYNDKNVTPSESTPVLAKYEGKVYALALSNDNTKILTIDGNEALVTLNKATLKTAASLENAFSTMISSVTGLPTTHSSLDGAVANGFYVYNSDSWPADLSSINLTDLQKIRDKNLFGIISPLNIFRGGWNDTSPLAVTNLVVEKQDYKEVTTEFNSLSLYTELQSAYSRDEESGYSLFDKGEYNFKFLTSGGYPAFETGSVCTKMMNLCEKRGDCYALIDHTNYVDRTLSTSSGSKSVFNKLQEMTGNNGTYAAMFTPWKVYKRVSSDKTINDAGDVVAKSTTGTFDAPASFGYLRAYADSIKNNASWLAIAGAARGKISGVDKESDNVVTISNGLADKMQQRTGRSLNAITKVNPYGEVIWGNRTLHQNDKNLTASSFLNIRNLVCDVKKLCYRAAKELTFEQNTDVLWVNFKAALCPTLDRMMSGYGVSGYKIERDYAHERANDKATLCAIIRLFPVYAVEDFYITVELRDDEVVIE